MVRQDRNPVPRDGDPPLNSEPYGPTGTGAGGRSPPGDDTGVTAVEGPGGGASGTTVRVGTATPTAGAVSSGAGASFERKMMWYSVTG